MIRLLLCLAIISWAISSSANLQGPQALTTSPVIRTPERISFSASDSAKCIPIWKLHSAKCIPIWKLHSAKCIPGATNCVGIGELYAKNYTKSSILHTTARTLSHTNGSYRWHTSLATFYDFNTWGWNRPGGRSGHFACGGRYLRSTIAVAHRTLPCGTIVRFCHNKVCLNVPVRDRFGGSGFDLTSEAAIRLNHVFTGPIKWRVIR